MDLTQHKYYSKVKQTTNNQIRALAVEPPSIPEHLIPANKRPEYISLRTTLSTLVIVIKGNVKADDNLCVPDVSLLSFAEAYYSYKYFSVSLLSSPKAASHLEKIEALSSFLTPDQLVVVNSVSPQASSSSSQSRRVRRQPRSSSRPSSSKKKK